MPRELKLFNSRTRKVELFQPLSPPAVGVYTCGPTVYSAAHIGNMRSFLFADLLKRSLKYFGFQVNHVMNITDVGHLTNENEDTGEDRLEVGAKREGLDAWGVAAKYTELYFKHADQLNIVRPDIVCKATDHIADQIEMVKALEDKGYTYGTDDGIYFDTSKFERYGDLARIDIEGLQEGHRVEQGQKRNKTDFALWKFSPTDEHRAMEWESPWGTGFPGWHIECSAMSRRFLGEQFDIHTGGEDLLPIHHTNEVAQAECASGKHPFVNVWMHGAFLVIGDGIKMSKSKGHVFTVEVLEANGIPPPAYRLLCLQSHYRKQLKFNDENIHGAVRCYERLTRVAGDLAAQAGPVEEDLALSAAAADYKAIFEEAIANDLNAPQAFSNLMTLIDDTKLSAAERVSLIRTHDRVLGIEPFHPVAVKTEVPQEWLDRLAARNQARLDKDWSKADQLRDEISAAGFEILDSPEGSTLKRKH